MIFRQVAEIMSGHKTQTRRPVKADEIAYTGLGNEIVAVVKNGRRVYRVGRAYPIIPKRAQPAVRIALDSAGGLLAYTTQHGEDYGLTWYPARIRILSIRCEQVQEISEADAIAEGVASVEEYRELWEMIHGPGSWQRNPWVWVYTFALALPRRKLIVGDTSLEAV